MNYEVEKQYTIAEDASGILYFFIKAKKNDPLNPQIIYDGFENIKDSYYTSLNMVEKIPVDWSKIGLKTWEEIALQQQ